MDVKHCTHCGKTIARHITSNTIRPFCDKICYGLWQRGKTHAEQGKLYEKPVRNCSVPGCTDEFSGRGYCRKHYMSLYYEPLQRAKRPKPGRVSTPRDWWHAATRCKQCGKEFLKEHKSAKYCSSRCWGDSRMRPFILKKGYRKVLIYGHPRADKKGYVFEHIVVAEAMIGRALRPKEEVHHLDMNRQNNVPSNLVVCKDHAEHMKYHLTPS